MRGKGSDFFDLRFAVFVYQFYVLCSMFFVLYPPKRRRRCISVETCPRTQYRGAAGACHEERDGKKRRCARWETGMIHLEYLRENAVVLVDCVFIFLNTATSIAAVMSTKYEIRVESVPGRPETNPTPIQPISLSI